MTEKLLKTVLRLHTLTTTTTNLYYYIEYVFYSTIIMMDILFLVQIRSAVSSVLLYTISKEPDG